jgi:uroporphyrinogen-III decarboxylase
MMQRHQAAVGALNGEMRRLGFPAAFGAAVVAPFDFISDTLRGMHGIMLDMYRRPEKILAAMEKLLPFQIENVLARAEASGNPRAMVVMHRGSDAFMSDEQWRTFYWPGYSKIILTLIDEGITPLLFLEGNVTSRLEYLAELPRGQALAMLDSTDMYRAKEVLGDVMCLCGMMPLSLLQTGTPEQVRQHTRTLIDVAGKGGGFIMGARSVLDEARPELVKTWFDYTREYGVYKR